METTKNAINYKKIIVNILFLLLFTSLIININPDFPFYHSVILRIVTSIIISGVAVFYIHNLVLFPILEQEADKRKYKNYVFVIGIVYFVFLLFFWIVNQENLYGSIFSLTYETLISTISKFFILALFPLLITVFLSYAYSTIFLGKKVAFQFLEFFINLIIVSLLYAVAVQADGGISAFLLTILLIVFYTNTFYVTPILVKKHQQSKYWFLVLAMSIFYLLATLSVFHSIGVIHISLNVFGIFCLIYILSFIYGYFRIKIISKEKLFTLKLGAKDSELQLLKSQVNPHFLFNTLNTLYATALEENAPKTAESTAKLASLIRYMQNDIDKDFIPLKNEIKYLQDYISIQKVRCEIEPRIATEFINIENHSISPGLLIPFVENAFKYGIDPSKPSKLKVSVICNENTINFECVNSYNDAFKTYYKEQGFGIGIKNAKQRLGLVYSKKHTFKVLKKDGVFSVNISINTK